MLCAVKSVSHPKEWHLLNSPTYGFVSKPTKGRAGESDGEGEKGLNPAGKFRATTVGNEQQMGEF